MKHAILALLILAFVIPASALELTEKGFKAGLNSSNIYGDEDIENNHAITSIALGGYLIYQYSDKITIQPELYYTGKGVNAKENTILYSEDLDLRLTYLEIPVLCGYHFQPDNKWDPTLYLGPYLGILLSAEVDGNDVKEDVKSMDYGLGLGFSVKYNRFTFDLRRSWGLTTYDGGDDPENIKNVNSQLIVGYSF